MCRDKRLKGFKWRGNRGIYIEMYVEELEYVNELKREILNNLRVNYGFCEIRIICAKIYKNWELINISAK